MTIKKKAPTKKKATKKATKKGKTKTVSFEVPVNGRPTKYDPKFCDTVIDMMTKGYSKQACAGEIGIAVDTFYQWVKKHKDFSDAVSIGEAKARLFFDKVLVNHITHSKNGQQINGQVYGLNMKNRFGFSDKKEVELGDKTTDTIKLAYSLDEPLEDDDSED